MIVFPEYHIDGMTYRVIGRGANEMIEMVQIMDPFQSAHEVAWEHFYGWSEVPAVYTRLAGAR